MKLIDTKGRFFGVINVIDLGVIVALITFGYIFFNLARNARLGYPLVIETKVLFPGVPVEVVKKILPWDREEKGKGLSKLLRFELIGTSYLDKDGQEVVDIHGWLNLSVRVKDVLVGNRGEKVASYFYRGEELNIDDPIIFTTSKYSIRGTILNIDRMDREIEVILSNEFSREVTEVIKVGDRVIRYNHLVGEVIAKEYTADGQVKVRLHVKRGEVFLKVGNLFPFETEDYCVQGIIVLSRPWQESVRKIRIN